MFFTILLISGMEDNNRRYQARESNSTNSQRMLGTGGKFFNLLFR